MKQIHITVRCLAEPKKHAKVIRVKAKLGRMRAMDLADLLDGSSLAYVHPPGANSPIGRCCQCQSEVECTVSTVLDGAEIEPTEEEAAAEKKHRDKKDERKLARQLVKIPSLGQRIIGSEMGGCEEAMRQLEAGAAASGAGALREPKRILPKQRPEAGLTEQ